MNVKDWVLIWISRHPESFSARDVYLHAPRGEGQGAKDYILVLEELVTEGFLVKTAAPKATSRGRPRGPSYTIASTWPNVIG